MPRNSSSDILTKQVHKVSLRQLSPSQMAPIRERVPRKVYPESLCKTILKTSRHSAASASASRTRA